MHELSIASELLRIIDQASTKERIKRVQKVDVRIGEHSGIFPDSLEFAFEILSKGRITEGAKLNIERVAPSFICQNCNREVGIQNGYCDRCGSEELMPAGGDELELISFEGER